MSRTRTLELQYCCRDGSTLWAEAKVTAVRDEKGQITGILGITRNITERKRAEDALRRSEEAARRLAEENAVMAEIGRIISSTLNLEEVYDRMESLGGSIDFQNLPGQGALFHIALP